MLSVKVEQSAQKKVRLQHTTQLIDSSINSSMKRVRLRHTRGTLDTPPLEAELQSAGGRRAGEGAPSERLRPVRGRLLHREERPPDRSP